MLDGGLVNPVPVSVCRAMGAEVVIAVNLNGQLIGRHFSRKTEESVRRARQQAQNGERGLLEKIARYFLSSDEAAGDDPGFFDVIGASVNIMQDRITRSRMAGEPADLSLVPLLNDFAIMDFHRADEAIEEGRRLVIEAEDRIRWLLGETSVD